LNESLKEIKRIGSFGIDTFRNTQQHSDDFNTEMKKPNPRNKKKYLRFISGETLECNTQKKAHEKGFVIVAVCRVSRLADSIFFHCAPCRTTINVL
jgi:hypothetical protein